MELDTGLFEKVKKDGSRKSSMASVKPSLYDRQSRESFASFKEDKNSVQSFVTSKVSSYARANGSGDEDAMESDEESVKDERIQKS